MTTVEEPAKVLPVRYVQESAIQGRVEVAGHDVSAQVSRVSIDHRAGQLPQVFLELRPGLDAGAIEVEGVVHVTREVRQDPMDAALAFLEPVDPAELERCALAAMEMGGPQTFGQAALEVLRGWARGD
jgi:hypothetical protein